MGTTIIFIFLTREFQRDYLILFVGWKPRNSRQADGKKGTSQVLQTRNFVTSLNVLLVWGLATRMHTIPLIGFSLNTWLPWIQIWLEVQDLPNIPVDLARYPVKFMDTATMKYSKQHDTMSNRSCCHCPPPPRKQSSFVLVTFLKILNSMAY